MFSVGFIKRLGLRVGVRTRSVYAGALVSPTPELSVGSTAQVPQ